MGDLAVGQRVFVACRLFASRMNGGCWFHIGHEAGVDVESISSMIELRWVSLDVCWRGQKIRLHPGEPAPGESLCGFVVGHVVSCEDQIQVWMPSREVYVLDRDLLTLYPIDYP